MKSLLWLLLGTAAFAAEPADFRSHSHNDYEQKEPLVTALTNRMGSVEADVWLIDGELRLGHRRQDTKPGWTLRSGYLDPLKARAKAGNGKIYPDGPPLVLLVDIKTEPEPTCVAILRELEADAALFTRFTEQGVTPGAITVIISGAVPIKLLADRPQRVAAVDGRPTHLDSNPSAALVPLVSDNWTNHFQWKGEGAMPAEESARLREFTRRAHEQGRKFRLWNAPDTEACWREQLAAGVDFINTDHPDALHRFLAAQKY